MKFVQIGLASRSEEYLFRFIQPISGITYAIEAVHFGNIYPPSAIEDVDITRPEPQRLARKSLGIGEIALQGEPDRLIAIAESDICVTIPNLRFGRVSISFVELLARLHANRPVFVTNSIIFVLWMLYVVSCAGLFYIAASVQKSCRSN